MTPPSRHFWLRNRESEWNCARHLKTELLKVYRMLTLKLKRNKFESPGKTGIFWCYCNHACLFLSVQADTNIPAVCLCESLRGCVWIIKQGHPASEALCSFHLLNKLLLISHEYPHSPHPPCCPPPSHMASKRITKHSFLAVIIIIMIFYCIKRIVISLFVYFCMTLEEFI